MTTLETPEWDRAIEANELFPILQGFVAWLEYQKGITITKHPDRLIAEYFGIDLDKLADEQEAYERYVRELKHAIINT